MNRAIFPGSFDPITLGHIDIVSRLAKIFSETIVLVADSNSKSALLHGEEREFLAKQSLSHLKNVFVRRHSGLTAEFVRQNAPAVLVRSLRNGSDFDFERSMGEANQKLLPTVETLFLSSSPELSCVSSTLVREIWRNHGDLNPFVPINVLEFLNKKSRETR